MTKIEAVIEPIPIDDEFAAGLAFARVVGPVAYLAFYVDQVMPPELGSTVERRIRRRLVLPRDALPALIKILEYARDHPEQFPAMVSNSSH